MLGLAYIGDAESVGIFKKALSASDADMKYFAIAALGQIKNEESAATLINLLRTDGAPKRKIVSLLEKFPDLIVSERLLPLMDERNTGTRFWSLKLMSRMNPGKHVDKISKMAHDVSAEVRAAACECLGNSKNKAAADTLSSALGDENWLVRASSVKALSTLLGDDSIPKIIALLKDSSLSVLSAVKDALVDHIDRAMPYIEKIYSGDDKMAALICVEAVQEAKRGKA
jgi:HEAT repeat protein